LEDVIRLNLEAASFINEAGSGRYLAGGSPNTRKLIAGREA
jgi:hypothetical protein